MTRPLAYLSCTNAMQIGQRQHSKHNAQSASFGVKRPFEIQCSISISRFVGSVRVSSATKTKNSGGNHFSPRITEPAQFLSQQKDLHLWKTTFEEISWKNQIGSRRERPQLQASLCDDRNERRTKRCLRAAEPSCVCLLFAWRGFKQGGCLGSELSRGSSHPQYHT